MNSTTNQIQESGHSPVVRRPGSAQSPAQSGAPLPSQWTYRPNVDIVDTDAAIEVYADVPGATGDSIDIAFEQDILSIEARVQTRRHETWTPVADEFGVGNFHRRFQIDAAIEPDAITADFDAGVLKITLPKAKQAQRRRIPVRA